MIEPAGSDDWHFGYQKAPLAAFFQSPAWAGVWERYTDGKFQPSPLLAALPSGRKVLIPATRQRLPVGLGHIWHIAPAGTYGGWLPISSEVSAASQLSVDEIQMLLQALGRYCKSLTFRWYPFLTDAQVPVFSDAQVPAFSDAQIPAFSDARIIVRNDRSYMIDGSVGEEALREQLYESDGKMRRKIAKARRSGIRIRKAGSSSDWAAYHQIYLQGIKRWSVPPQHIYRLAFFDLLASMPDHCELWLAELNDTPVAGAVLLYGNNHVVYWHGAFDYERRALRPVNLLLATAIESVCRKGYRWFDFNPSLGMSGVEQFKSSFGATPFACPVINRTSAAVKLWNIAGRWVQRTGIRKQQQ